MYAWDKFVELQERELGQETATKWLRSLKVVRFDACNLYLEAKDTFQAMWFEEHMRQKVSTHLVNNNKRRIKVHLLVANSSQAPKTRKIVKKSEKTSSTPQFSLQFDELNPQKNFSNLIVAKSNLLPVKVMNETIACAKEKRSGSFNPIYIYGPKGSGKSHLLMATCVELKKQGVSVVYARAETFADHVVASIRMGEMSTFRQAYRNSDVLIIDDVHVFSKKGATQEEFFHTFNTLHIAGKQIILSANSAPSELQNIEPRLVSRFEWGIALGLEFQDREMLEQIVLKHAELLKFSIHAKVVEFLIDTFSNCSAVIKALEALILRTHLKKSIVRTLHQLTVPVAKELLSDLLLEEQKAALTPEKIVHEAASYFGIKPEDVLGKNQTRECVLPRQICMHLCRHELKLPYAVIGDVFGKDHSTVMSSVKLIHKAIESDDKEIAGSYRAILKKVR